MMMRSKVDAVPQKRLKACLTRLMPHDVPAGVCLRLLVSNNLPHMSLLGAKWPVQCNHSCNISSPNARKNKTWRLGESHDETLCVQSVESFNTADWVEGIEHEGSQKVPLSMRRVTHHALPMGDHSPGDWGTCIAQRARDNGCCCRCRLQSCGAAARSP